MSVEWWYSEKQPRAASSQTMVVSKPFVMNQGIWLALRMDVVAYLPPQ